MPPSLSGKLSQLSTSICGGSLNTFAVFTRNFGIKSLSKPIHNPYNVGSGLPVLESTPAAALRRKANSLPLRSGAIGIKQGMTAVYDPETGKRTACTVLQLDRVEVVSHKTVTKHGYWAVQVGAGWKHPRNVTKAMLGHFGSQGVSPKRHVFEFRVKDEAGLLPVGQSIQANWFQEGQFVDARSNTKGKGFAGVMKRHGFHGQDRSHGVSLTHRSMGSSGQGQGGGSRVYPGKKMAGNMGNNRNTVQNLKILKVDQEAGIVVVSGKNTPWDYFLDFQLICSIGAISGPKGCTVRLQDAIKKPWPKIESEAPSKDATA